ncbi:hypothetical protein SD71_05180 [Cohnella kolymensis]|uniref:Uncharacterized protein n=1 Tax=Cohnella kolymensis TaxID=1590652 RepID=A0ABR5A9F5_9BACL|nr:hypothetical protein [Cohnella kolymensis]KIL37047.1 hypothetical protein SD71_05180 [Cohnella kolymensis]
MRVITNGQLESRVNIVIDVIKEVAGQDTLPDRLTEKLRAMTYDDLGKLVMDIVKTRKIDHIME